MNSVLSAVRLQSTSSVRTTKTGPLRRKRLVLTVFHTMLIAYIYICRRSGCDPRLDCRCGFSAMVLQSVHIGARAPIPRLLLQGPCSSLPIPSGTGLLRRPRSRATFCKIWRHVPHGAGIKEAGWPLRLSDGRDSPRPHTEPNEHNPAIPCLRPPMDLSWRNRGPSWPSLSRNRPLLRPRPRARVVRASQSGTAEAFST